MLFESPSWKGTFRFFESSIKLWLKLPAEAPGILKFISVKIQSMTRKPKQYGQCHHSFYLQLVWWEELGAGLSRKFDVNKAFTTELFSFSFVLFSSIFYIYRERRLCGQNLLSLLFADTSSNLCAQGTSTCMIHTGVAQDADLSLLLDALFLGKPSLVI